MPIRTARPACPRGRRTPRRAPRRVRARRRARPRCPPARPRARGSRPRGRRPRRRCSSRPDPRRAGAPRRRRSARCAARGRRSTGRRRPPRRARSRRARPAAARPEPGSDPSPRRAGTRARAAAPDVVEHLDEAGRAVRMRDRHRSSHRVSLLSVEDVPSYLRLDLNRLLPRVQTFLLHPRKRSSRVARVTVTGPPGAWRTISRPHSHVEGAADRQSDPIRKKTCSPGSGPGSSFDSVASRAASLTKELRRRRRSSGVTVAGVAGSTTRGAFVPRASDERCRGLAVQTSNSGGAE